MIKRGDMILIPKVHDVRIAMVSEVLGDMIVVQTQDEQSKALILYPDEVKQYKESYDYFRNEAGKTLTISDETGRQVYV